MIVCRKGKIKTNYTFNLLLRLVYKDVFFLELIIDNK